MTLAGFRLDIPAPAFEFRRRRERWLDVDPGALAAKMQNEKRNTLILPRILATKSEKILGTILVLDQNYCLVLD